MKNFDADLKKVNMICVHAHKLFSQCDSKLNIDVLVDVVVLFSSTQHIYLFDE